MALIKREKWIDKKNKTRYRATLSCDMNGCDKVYETEISNYYQYKKKHNGKNYCRKCVNKLTGERKKGTPSPLKGIARPSMRGENSPSWTGGRYISSDGYVMIRIKHRSAHDKEISSGWSSYRKEHLLVVEKDIGRPIKKGEVVHHKDGDKQHNDLENLYLCKDDSEHRKCHTSLQKIGYELFKRGIIGFENGTYFLKDGYER